MALYHGKDGKVRINSAVLEVTEWVGDVKAQKHDVTNSESGGYGTYQGGVLDVDPISIDGQYKVGTTPLASLPPGSTVAGVVLYCGGTGGAHLDVTLYVESFKITSRVRDIVTFQITGCASGTFSTTSL